MEEKLQIRQQRIDIFKKALKGMMATSSAAYSRTDNKFVRTRQRDYSRDEIDRIVAEGDPVERARLSEYFFATDGLYKRIIIHYATFLTYSWILVPYVKNSLKKGKITERKTAATYYNASEFCTTFQIERKCAIFAKDILVKGGYYGLLHDEGENVVIQDLPFDFCRSRFKNSQDIDIVEFNVAFFDTIRDDQLREEILKTYPNFISKAYKAYHNRGENRWIFLPAEVGIYFCFFEERPFFLDLIPLLDDLNDYKDLDKQRNIKAIKHILVQEIPHDGMKLVFEPEEAQEMHEGALDMVQNNKDLDVLTSYGKISLLDMSAKDDEKTEVTDVQDLIYSSAGLSKELFFATTEAGLEYSINNDLAMVMIMGEMFAHFFTVLLNYKFETKNIKFKLIILPLSYYNSADYTSRAKELATLGYSFLTPILSTGIDQTNLAALKTLENDLLHLDEVLKPLQTSYTQSGKVANEVNKNSSETKTSNENDNNNEKENTTKEDDSTEDKKSSPQESKEKK